MNEEKHAMKLAHWTSIIREANTSGKTIVQWCSENQLSIRSYYYWHKRVMHSTYKTLIENGFQSPSELPEANSEKTTAPVPVFAELKPPAVCKWGSSAAVIILESGNFKIRIEDGFSEECLEKVIRVISHAQCRCRHCFQKGIHSLWTHRSQIWGHRIGNTRENKVPSGSL